MYLRIAKIFIFTVFCDICTHAMGAGDLQLQYSYGLNASVSGTVHVAYDSSESTSILSLTLGGNANPVFYSSIHLTDKGWVQKAIQNGEYVEYEVDVEEYEKHSIAGQVLDCITRKYCDKLDEFCPKFTLNIEDETLTARLDITSSFDQCPVYSWGHGKSNSIQICSGFSQYAEKGNCYTINPSNVLVSIISTSSGRFLNLVPVDNNLEMADFSMIEKKKTNTVSRSTVDEITKRAYMARALKQLPGPATLNDWINENITILEPELRKIGEHYYRVNSSADEFKKMVVAAHELSSNFSSEEEKRLFLSKLVSKMTILDSSEISDKYISKGHVLLLIKERCYPSVIQGMVNALLGDAFGVGVAPESAGS